MKIKSKMKMKVIFLPLTMQHVNPRKSIQTSNYNIDRGILTMLASNYFQEQSFTTAAATYGAGAAVDAQDLTVQLRCHGLCSHTFWRLVDVSTDSEYNKQTTKGRL
jgi:hypothetical protein